MVSDLRIALWVGLAVLGLTEALALTGITQPPHERLLGIYASPHAVFVLGEFAVVFCILYLCSRPRWREIAAAGAGGVLLAGIYLALRPHEAARPVSDWLYLLIGAFGLAVLVALVARVRKTPSQRPLALTLVAAFALVLVYDTFVVSLLGFTAALHPRTYDAIAFNLDATLGFSPATVAALVVNAWPPLLAVVAAVYDYLPYAFAVLYGLQLARPERAPVSLLLAYAVSGAIAIFLYHACPIAGPRYAFGDHFYAWPVAPASDLLAVPPAPRNGMPSMHFGWALLMWMHASFIGRGARAVFAVLAGLMFLATLGLGQHYLVDLAASLPAIVAVQALCATGLGWDKRERLRALVAGGMLTLAWILAVRYGIALFEAVPALTWAALVATVAASVWLYLPLARALRGAPPAVLREERTAAARTGPRREPAYAAAMFVVSGLAALMYQVLFSKSLALTFGSTSTATYTVLAVYMGGMALGAWLGGRLAQGRSDALKLYARCELGIGAYCVATPLIFKGIQALYVALASGMAPDAGMLTVLRALLGASALLVPTVLMGATLPVLARFLELRAATLGPSVALLYGANTVGAALGALLAGYWILPELGVWRTTLTAAALNLGVAWLALWLARRPPPEGQPTAPPPAAVPRVVGLEARRLGQAALVVLAVGGVVTLALEVNYIHLLAVVAGNSVYAFSLMLFAFLLGLGAGAEVARRLLRVGISLPLALAWLEFALAAVILGGVFLWDGLPAYFVSFEQYPLAREFAAREVVRGAVCWVAMFPPAVLIGALYPLAMECVGRADPDAPIAALGRAAGLNTAGNIVGVLAAGFWLLPVIGALRSIQLLAVICLVLGLATIAWTAVKWRALAWAPAAVVVLLLIVQPRTFDYTALASGANVYFMRQDYGRVIDAVESVDGGLTTVARGAPVAGWVPLVLLTNGKFQGGNGGEVPAQIGFGLAPLLHTPARGSALVIGYGTGMTARVIADAGFREVEIVELSADIVRLANRYFADINKGVSERRGVRTYITDGRNFLMLQPRRYDVVSMEITSIWFAGGASVYNREFYRLVRRRLAPHGVLQQWLQLHHVEPTDILHVLSSVRAEFEHVWLYFIGTQGIIIATNGPDARPSAQNAALIDATPALKQLLASVEGSARDLLETRLLDPAATDLFLGSFGMPAPFWVSTDDNLKLEYSTPKGNALDGARSIEQNIELLLRFAAATRGASK